MKLRNTKYFVSVLLALVILFHTTSPVLATTSTTDTQDTTHHIPSPPSITAESAIVMEASTGLVLYEKNSTESKYPASITKIMTTLLALENSSLNETVTFSRDAIFGVELASSRIGIDVGEQLSMEEALYAIMLASANEVSYGVAEHVSGSLEGFVSMMNERANELGCVNTHFANPHGLHDQDHYTCAYDMALIAREAIKNTMFQQITSSRTFVIPPTNIQSEARPLANHHKFIKRDLHYDGVIGGKTGYTSAAKYTLVTYAKRQDMELICVVMASDSTTTEYTDTSSLLDYVFDNYSFYNISSDDNKYFADDSPLFKKYSTIFHPKYSFLTTGENGAIVLPNYASLSDVTREVEYQTVSDSIKYPRVIGSVTYSYLGNIVGKTDIIYRESSNKVLPTRINSLLDISASTTISNYRSDKKSNSIIWIVGIVLLSMILFITAWLIYKKKKCRNSYLRSRQRYYNKY